VISGYVKSESGAAIPGATVAVKNTSRGTACDANGFYSFPALRPGSYLLEISAIGYHPVSEKVTMKAHQALELNFSLKENQQDLQEVIVVGKTENQQVKEQAFAVNAIETKQFANTTADLNQVLNRSTGVRIREQGGLGSNFNFSINGLSGKAVKYFIDGVPLELLGSAVSLNNIPVNLAERIEVYKGVVPVQLGSDAMGGAVNVITNQNQRNYLDLSHSYGSFQYAPFGTFGAVCS
jgi:outer membrane cobalamin receptor